MDGLLEGKKDKRVMVRITENMWDRIETIVKFTGLPKEYVIRACIADALSQNRMNWGNGTLVPMRQQTSANLFPEEGAEPQSSTTVRNRQQSRRERA